MSLVRFQDMWPLHKNQLYFIFQQQIIRNLKFKSNNIYDSIKKMKYLRDKFGKRKLYNVAERH